MIHYLRTKQLDRHPHLASGMFRHRAVQFRDRLHWGVSVDQAGWETDQYDRLDPLYVIAQDERGDHAGSMRFLPTMGRTMVAEVFPHLIADAPLRSPRIWECTRFCLAPGRTDVGTARGLLLGGAQMGLQMGLTHAIGVFDDAMVRVYRHIGWEPKILGSANGISAGCWTLSHDVVARLAARQDAAARGSSIIDHGLTNVEPPCALPSCAA